MPFIACEARHVSLPRSAASETVCSWVTYRGDGLLAHAGGTDSSATSGAATKPYRLAAPSKPYCLAAPFSAKPAPAKPTQVTYPSTGLRWLLRAWCFVNTMHRLLERMQALGSVTEM